MLTNKNKLMENLEQVTREKLNMKIGQGAKTAAEAFDRLVSEGKMSKDFIVPVGTNNDQRNQVLNFDSNGVLKMGVKGDQFELHKNAVRQLAEKNGVPAKYLVQLAEGSEWEKSLAAKILNEHSGYTKRERLLVRSVGSQVRGVLSDQYRRLNSPEIIQAFVTAAYNQGAVLADGLMTDTRVYMETLLPDLIPVNTPKNGTIMMAVGARLSTSDYGDGALELRVFTLNGICLNGMVRESVMRTVHLGSRLPDNISLSERTYKLDTRTQISTLNDVTKGIFSKDRILLEMEKVQDASFQEIDLEKEIKELPKKGLSKEESGKVGNILTNGRADDGVSGEPTLWKLVNGVTALGRDTTGSRGREIQEIAGKLMDRAKKK